MRKRSRTTLALTGLWLAALILVANWLDTRSTVGPAGKTIVMGLGLLALWACWNFQGLRGAWRADRARRRS